MRQNETYMLVTADQGQPAVLAQGITSLDEVERLSRYCLQEGYKTLAIKVVQLPKVESGLDRLWQNLFGQGGAA